MDAILVDGYDGSAPGPAFGAETEDLDITVLAWPEHFSIDPHVNSEVDVVTIVLSGTGTATIDGKDFALRLGSILLIPKGATRSVRSNSVDFRYVNIHKRRRRLMPQVDGGRPPR